jgi:hypothetical protein
MNSEKYRKLFFIALLVQLSLWACTSDFAIDFPGYEKTTVCNCLFTEQNTWRVWVGHTQPFASVYNDNGIADAKVLVIGEKGDTIELFHSHKGNYVHPHKKPERGTNYRLLVFAGNDSLASGWSRIPDGAGISITEVIENPGLVQYDYGTMNEVMEIRCSFTKAHQGFSYVKIEAFLDNPEDIVELYTFNRAVFDSILDQGYSTALIAPLLRLDGDTIYGKYDLQYLMGKLLNLPPDGKEYKAIQQAAFLGSFQAGELGMILPIECFSNSPNFSKYENNFRVLLGVFDQDTRFNVHLWDFLEGDLWLESALLSYEAYHYHQRYIQQLEGRIDFGQLLQPAYSNMSNGLGIFAGLSAQKIKVAR